MQSPQYLKKKQNNNNKRPNEKQICDMNKEKPEIKCYQLNFKKILLASVEFNKSILKEKRTLCFATEPYILQLCRKSWKRPKSLSTWGLETKSGNHL